MSKFGDTLRACRQASNDPDRLNRRLTQERLGELMGREMGDLGFSGAAISDWERGKSRISAEDRNVLVALIIVLHECGGLRTPDEADQLLKAGNFRTLSSDEAQKIRKADAPDMLAESSSRRWPKDSPHHSYAVWSVFFESPQDFQTMLEKAKDGPPPVWPRVMAAFFRWVTDRFSVSDALIFVLWMWVIWLTNILLMPSLHWPFASQDDAVSAVILYAGGTIAIPALIGVLSNTSNNGFWREHGLENKLVVRLYTHQGASIGFHLGYFLIFTISLLGYNIGGFSTLWFELPAAVILVVLGYAGARLVPYNLLLAYERLNPMDGMIFFVFPLVGPAWGYFFLESYHILLKQSLGIFVFLLALTILLVMMALRQRQKNDLD